MKISVSDIVGLAGVFAIFLLFRMQMRWLCVRATKEWFADHDFEICPDHPVRFYFRHRPPRIELVGKQGVEQFVFKFEIGSGLSQLPDLRRAFYGNAHLLSKKLLTPATDDSSK
jgi:hypothetical protein